MSSFMLFSICATYCTLSVEKKENAFSISPAGFSTREELFCGKELQGKIGFKAEVADARNLKICYDKAVHNCVIGGSNMSLLEQLDRKSVV